ncbi:MAG: PAS domain S-box protein [Polyangiaceae bacterium]|nr:PAS domain S-box protein [Polyangiaceae bacterium]
MLTADDLFEAIFASSPLGIAVLDDGARLYRSNPALQRMFGRSEAELRTLTFAELLRSPDAAADAARCADVRAGRRDDDTVEREYRRKDGSTSWGRFRFSRHPCAAGSFVIATMEDIGASRAAEQSRRDIAQRLGERIKELTALHRAAELMLHRQGTCEERLHVVATLLPPAMQYPDIATGCIRYKGQTFATPGHETTPWMLTVPWTMANGQIGEIEVAYREARPASVFGPFLAEEHALLTSLAEMIHASLDRHDAEDALRQANERFHLALNTAGMGIWEWDVVENTVCWAEPLPQVQTFGARMMPFGTYTHLVHPEEQEYVLGRLARAAAGEDDLRGIECRMRRDDGTYRHWAGDGCIVRGPNGRATRILVALIDVTERRALEERLRQGQKIEALGQVAGSVAHDFNNVLAILFSGIGTLRDDIPGSDSWRETIDDCLMACERGQTLTRQLLAFSRKTPFKPTAIDVSELITTLRPLLVRVAPKSVDLRIEVDSAAREVWADPAQIEQVVLNLVVNARDAMTKGGTIVVATQFVDEEQSARFGASPGRYAAIVVRDDGVGITPDIFPKILEPFFTTKEVGKGTGLGLAVVADIVRRWHGHVHVESTPGEGATFRVLLPQVRES